MNVYEVVTKRILDRLEEGNIAPWQKMWSGNKAFGQPTNLVTGKPYRGMNRIILACSGFNSNHYMTFNQAKAIGATVNKGEKGFPVIFWKKIEDDVKDDEYFLLRYYTVFNIDQISGIPASKLPVVNVDKDFNGIAIADGILASNVIPKVTYGGDKACYSPDLDKIMLPNKTDFKSVEAYYETAFHEAVHSTGHESRLNRDIRNLFGSHKYSCEELIAEIGASFLMAECRIENKAILENQVSYLKCWLKALKDHPKMIIQASGKAQKAVDLILGRTVTA